MDVAHICNGLQIFFKHFRKCFFSVSFVFFCMLQMLLLDVSKVDHVLHMGYAWKAVGGADDVRGDVDESGTTRAHC